MTIAHLDLQIPPPLRVGEVVRIMRGGLGAIGKIAEAGWHASGFAFYRVLIGSGPSALYWEQEVEALTVTLRHYIEGHGHRMKEIRRGHLMSSAESLEQFRSGDWDDLSQRPVGNADDIAPTTANTTSALELLRQTAVYLEKLGTTELPDPLNYGAAMILAAAQTVGSALLLHLRKAMWNEHAALAVSRTALEALVTGSALLSDADGCVARWLQGDRVNATKYMPLLGAALKTKRADTPDPAVVYEWLSRHTHFTRDALMRSHVSSTQPLDHTASYAALSYIGWATAAMAEIVSGYDQVAEWPARWPSPLPWEL